MSQATLIKVANLIKAINTSAFLAIIFAVTGTANAAIIGASSFTGSTIVDFESAPYGLINTNYSALGVTFINLSGGYNYNTGNGYSYTATNFADIPGFPDGVAMFSAPAQRAGFDITTNDGDHTTVYAYSGASLVGSEYFITGGFGSTGSFAGIEFLSGFDRLIIHAEHTNNGAFAIDNFRFEGHPVPVPATGWLLGSGLLGLMGLARRSV